MNARRVAEQPTASVATKVVCLNPEITDLQLFHVCAGPHVINPCERERMLELTWVICGLVRRQLGVLEHVEHCGLSSIVESKEQNLCIL